MLKTIMSTMTGIALVLAGGIAAIRHDDARLSPRLITYQGFITDTLGNPVTNPTLSMTFGIWTASGGGSQQWYESQVMNVSRGVFSAVLGTITPIPDSVFTKGTDRWLELTVAGITLSPRTRIAAVPYAYSATHSDTAQYAKAAPPVGPASGDLTGSYPGPVITDKAVTAPKILDTAVTMAKIARAGAATGQVLKWNGTAWQPATDVAAADTDWIFSGNNIYSGVSGNVGIGTSTPLNRLSVTGVICGGTYDTVQAVYGGILAGYDNLAGDDIADTAALVAGGRENNATAKYSTVSGGRSNTADTSYTTVGGGYDNLAGEIYATVGGGYGDTASGYYSTVAGGRINTATDYYTSVGGGYSNAATGYGSTIGGGYNNGGDASYVVVGGGYQNAALGTYSTVGGGRRDSVTGNYGGVFSGYMNIAGDASDDTAAVILGGYNNHVVSRYSVIGGGRDNAAAGEYSVALGGSADTVNAKNSAVLSGHSNQNGDAATDSGSVIGGGYDNTITSSFASVLGGRRNYARGDYAAIGGGYANNADSTLSTVGGGIGNYGRGYYATVSGGYYNIASNFCATVPGGADNVASGMYSFAAGRNAEAPYPGDFVWADALTTTSFAATDTNQFVIQARGGVGIGTNNPEAQLDVAGDLCVTGAYRGNLGPNNGAPFPRPAYDSGWQTIAVGDTLVLTHNIGGNVDDYVVDFMNKTTGSYGIHNQSIGLEAHPNGNMYGTMYRRLSTTSIVVYRAPEDNYSPQVRVRIWVIN